MKGLLMGLGLGLGMNIVFGVAEGPYYYDPEQHTPEEYEFHKSALSRFLYKYWFTSQRVTSFSPVFFNSSKSRLPIGRHTPVCFSRMKFDPRTDW